MIDVIQGNACHIPLADGVVQCVVTSPPYWGLRDYGTARWVGGDEGCDHKPGNKRRVGKTTLDGGTATAGHQQEGSRSVCGKCGARRVDAQIGLERTPEEYVGHLVDVFREVRRVLRDDGTVWLNLGDSYYGGKGQSSQAWSTEHQDRNTLEKSYHQITGMGQTRPSDLPQDGLKPKDLVGIPWAVAFALRADGWYLRSEVIWHKPNPMPESVTDRPTKSHEHVFLLSKSAHYFYDADAVRQPLAESSIPRAMRGISENNKWIEGAPGSTAHTISRPRPNIKNAAGSQAGAGSSFRDGHSGAYSADGRLLINEAGANLRSVWTVATQSYSGAHFATFPEKLVEPCVLAGTSARGACPKCGSPWARVVERVVLPPADRKNNNAFKHDATTTHGEGKSTLRNVVVTTTAHDGKSETAYEDGTNANRLALLRQAARERGGEYVNESETVGWRPGCECIREACPCVALGEGGWDELIDRAAREFAPVPCLVLDPFAGTGTVGRVCARHGRNFVGVELKFDYIELARARMSGVQIEAL
jgi:DNA modification methylase